MLELTRIYKNTDGEELRMDTIIMEQKLDGISFIERNKNNKVHKRLVNTIRLHTTTTREVTSIELVGNYDSCETVSGNYTYAIWNDKAGNEFVRCNMSDLPIVGNNV